MGYGRWSSGWKGEALVKSHPPPQVALPQPSAVVSQHPQGFIMHSITTFLNPASVGTPHGKDRKRRMG